MCHATSNIKKNHCVMTSKFWAFSFSLEDRQAMLSFSHFMDLVKLNICYKYTICYALLYRESGSIFTRKSLDTENHKL